MIDKVFFDTNVLLYAFVSRSAEPLDPRTKVAEGVLHRGGFVSVQVLNEYADVASRKYHQGWTAILSHLEVVEQLCGTAIPLTIDTNRVAIRISARYGFRIYDSLILASAVEAGCNVLYTEDLQHGQVIEGVRIENPFLVR